LRLGRASVSLTVAAILPLALVAAATAQYEELVARVSSSVVLVRAYKPGIGMAVGSGFAIRADGYVLTAKHIIEGSRSVAVSLSTGSSLTAYLTEFHSVLDAALLKVAEPISLVALKSKTSVNVGEEVLLLGYPLPGALGVTTVSVVRGLLSAVREDHLQIDASAHPGMSGGPVVDRNGMVLGLTSFRLGNPPTIVFAVRIGSLGGLVENARPIPREAPRLPPSSYPLTGIWTLFWRTEDGRLDGPALIRCTQIEEQVTCEGWRPGAILQGPVLTPRDYDQDPILRFTLSSETREAAARFEGALVRPGYAEGRYEVRLRALIGWIYRERGRWWALKT
jgi:putative serine protease PepD